MRETPDRPARLPDRVATAGATGPLIPRRGRGGVHRAEGAAGANGGVSGLGRPGHAGQAFLDAQAELLACTVDQGELARLAQPVQVGQGRVPGIRLHDDRLIRLLDVLLHPGSFVADWTSRDVLARLLDRHRLTETDYRLTQLRYDLGKLRARGLVERIGRIRRYRLTTRGLKLGVLLVKLRTSLLGPLATLATAPASKPETTTDSAVEAAFRQVDRAIDHLCATLRLKPVA